MEIRIQHRHSPGRNNNRLYVVDKSEPSYPRRHLSIESLHIEFI